MSFFSLQHNPLEKRCMSHIHRPGIGLQISFHLSLPANFSSTQIYLRQFNFPSSTKYSFTHIDRKNLFSNSPSSHNSSDLELISYFTLPFRSSWLSSVFTPSCHVHPNTIKLSHFFNISSSFSNSKSFFNKKNQGTRNYRCRFRNSHYHHWINHRPSEIDANAKDSYSTNAFPSVNTNPLTRQQKNEMDRQIAHIYLPALGALALDPIVSLCDTAMVGKLGSLALGGVAISNTIFNLFFMCLNFIGIATTPLIAMAYGKNDPHQASVAVSNALWLALVVGTIAAIILASFASNVVSLFGAKSKVLPYAVTYLRARVIAAPFFLATMVFQACFRGYQDTKTPFYVSIFADIVNLSLFPLFIFVFKWGCIGAGLATSLAQITLCMGLGLLLLKKKMFDPRDMLLSRLKNIYSLFKAGIVLSVRTFSIMSAVSFATATSAHMGTKQIAAFEICRQLYALFARLLDAISVTAQSLVPVALGKNDYTGARRISNRLLQAGLILGSIFGTLLLIGTNVLPKMFTTDPAVLLFVQTSLPVMALCQPVNGLVFSLDGIYTAARQYTFLSWTVFTAATICCALLTLVKRSNWPLFCVWHALNSMMVIRALVLGFKYLRHKNPIRQATQLNFHANHHNDLDATPRENTS